MKFKKSIGKGTVIADTVRIEGNQKLEINTKEIEKYDPNLRQIWDAHIGRHGQHTQPYMIMRYKEKKGRNIIDNTIIYNIDGSFTKKRQLGTKQEIYSLSQDKTGQYELYDKGHQYSNRRIKLTKQDKTLNVISDSRKTIKATTIKKGQTKKQQIETYSEKKLFENLIHGYFSKNTALLGRLVEHYRTEKRIKIDKIVNDVYTNTLRVTENQIGRPLYKSERQHLKRYIQNYAIQWQGKGKQTLVKPGIISKHQWIHGNVQKQLYKRIGPKDVRIRLQRKLSSDVKTYKLKKERRKILDKLNKKAQILVHKKPVPLYERKPLFDPKHRSSYKFTPPNFKYKTRSKQRARLNLARKSYLDTQTLQHTQSLLETKPRSKQQQQEDIKQKQEQDLKSKLRVNIHPTHKFMYQTQIHEPIKEKIKIKTRFKTKQAIKTRIGEDQLKKLITAYAVKLRMKRGISQTKPLSTKKEAIRTGMKITDNTPINKFKIVQLKTTKQELKKPLNYQKPQKFRRQGGTYIEKRYYRMDTKQERNSDYSIMRQLM